MLLAYRNIAIPLQRQKQYQPLIKCFLRSSFFSTTTDPPYMVSSDEFLSAEEVRRIPVPVLRESQRMEMYRLHVQVDNNYK